MNPTALITLLALTLPTLAAPSLPPSKRQSGPSQQDVIDAIKRWKTDVDTLNSFVDLARLDPTSQIGDSAESAIPSARDEPNELAILSSISALSDDALNAIETLHRNLANGNIENILEGIVGASEANSPDGIEQQFEELNGIRCYDVLPALDVLWTAAATSEGVADQVILAAPRPDVCAEVEQSGCN